MHRVRKQLDLPEHHARILEQLALVTCSTQSDIAAEGIFYSYAIRYTLPSEVADLLQSMLREAMKGLALDIDI